ncbi:MAG: HAD hydrolase-like protein [Dehalobacterium sp.]
MVTGIISGIITYIIIAITVKLYKYYFENNYQFRRYLVKFIKHLQDNLYYISRTNFNIISDYVPVSALLYRFDEHNKSVIPIPGDVREFLYNSIKTNKLNNFYLILGEFGTGKTTLVTRLAYDLSNLYLNDEHKCLTILVNMKWFTSSSDIISEAARVIREKNNIASCSREYLVHKVRDGEITLILDGLDEYLNGNSRLFPTKELKLLEEIVTPKANVIVTSRRCIFRTSDEMMEYIKGRSEDPSIIPNRIFNITPIKVIELQLLNNDQIKLVLTKRKIDNRYIQAIFENKNILELARQHVLLDMIIQTIPSVDFMNLKGLCLAKLYQSYVNSSVMRDEERLPLPIQDIEGICQDIAVNMYQSNNEELDQEALFKIINTYLLEKGYGSEQAKVRKFISSLLFITFTEGRNYRFIHRTIMEFFVAKGLVLAIKIKKFEGLDVKSIAYHESICHFARELLTENDITILEELLKNENPWVRFLAAHFISRLNHKRAIQQIMQLLLTEKNFIVLREFYIALAFLGNVEYFHNYIEYLDENSNEDIQNDRMIIEYFGGSTSAIDGCVQRLIEREDYPTREMLIRFLGHKGSRVHIPLLRKYLYDRVGPVKDTTYKAIDDIQKRNKKPEIVRALLLDLDGVVIDSISGHIEAWKKVCHDKGIFLDEEIIKYNEGLKSTEVAKKIFNSVSKSYTEEQINDLVNEKNQLMLNEKSIKLMPHVKDLAFAAKKIGAEVALVTASSKTWAEIAVHMVGGGLISHIVSEEDTKVGKPSPEPYILALKKANCSAGEAIVIENAPLGIDSALNAGIYCIGITSTLKKDLLIGADKIIDNLLEAIELIDSY